MKNDLTRLVEEAQAGSSQAFSELYGFYAIDLYKFALYYMCNSADAEDCVQEAVLVAFRSIAKLRKADSFKSWFFKILSNVCKSKLTSPADRLQTVPIHEVADTEKDSTLDDLGLKTEVSDALNSLDADEKRIVLLSVIGRYKSSEIADILDCPSGTVRSKLSRSLNKLRDILQ